MSGRSAAHDAFESLLHQGVLAGCEFATVDPTLERLLGRPPLAIRDALAAHSSG